MLFEAAEADASRVGAIPLGLTALTGFGISLAVLYPGQYPFDSAFQIWQARSGEFSNITPVPMLGLWAILLRLSGNPASLFCVNLAMFWVGLGLAALAMRGPVSWRMVILIVCGLNPLSLVQMSHLLSDAHLAALLILALGLVASATRWQRNGLLWIAAALILYAGTIRQNALIAVLPLGALLATAWLQDHPASVRRMLLAATGTCLLAGALGFALDRALVVERRPLWPMLALWDLAAISVATDELQLPAFTHGAGLSTQELRDTGAFDPVTATSLFAHSRSGIGSGLDHPYPPEQRAELARVWLKSVLEHPRAWLAHRMRTMALLCGRHDAQPRGVAYYRDRAGFRDNPRLPEAWFPATQDAFYDVAARLSTGWVFSAMPYLLTHAAVAVWAWLRRRRNDPALVIGTALSALLYTASFVVLAPSTELRYLTWPIVSAPLVLAFAIGMQRPARNQRRSGPATAEATR